MQEMNNIGTVRARQIGVTGLRRARHDAGVDDFTRAVAVDTTNLGAGKCHTAPHTDQHSHSTIHSFYTVS